jgi:hypothetical protein
MHQLILFIKCVIPAPPIETPNPQEIIFSNVFVKQDFTKILHKIVLLVTIHASLVKVLTQEIVLLVQLIVLET